MLIGLFGLWFVPMLLFSIFELQGIPYLWVPIILALIYEFFRLPFLLRKTNVKIHEKIQTLSNFD